MIYYDGDDVCVSIRYRITHLEVGDMLIADILHEHKFRNYACEQNRLGLMRIRVNTDRTHRTVTATRME